MATKSFQMFDRSTYAVLFVASVLSAVAVLGTVALSFDHMSQSVQTVDHVEEVVVQG